MLRKLVKPIGGLMFGWSLLAGGSAEAQTTGYVNTMTPPSATPVASSGPAVTGGSATGITRLGYSEPAYSAPNAPVIASGAANDDCPPGVWFNMDYVLWWLSSAPAPGPLLTTGSVLDPNSGAIGQPNTRVVLGDQSISNNAFNGLRVGAGTWIDEARTVGYEASGFTLEHRRNFQGFAANANGSPFLVRPFLNSQTNQQDTVLVAFPGIQTGGLSEVSSTRFTGWDFNFAFNGTDDATFRADGLLGFRALYLSESLTVQQGITSLVDQTQFGGALGVGQGLNIQDRFATQSNFYGGQVGGRLTWISDRFITTATAKVALGVTDELAQLTGSSAAANGNGGSVGSGFLVNNGNQGRYFTNNFAVVPELSINIGYRIGKYTTLRAGYSVLYWSDVVRPGNTVSTTINPALVPALQGFGVGPNTAPPQSISSTDFWAQGLNLGLEFRF